MKKLLAIILFTIVCSTTACSYEEIVQEVNASQESTNNGYLKIRNNEKVDLLNSDGYGNIRLAVETTLVDAAAENGASTSVITDMIAYLNTGKGLVKGWMTSVVGSESYSSYFEVEVELDSNDNVESMNWITIE